jgi:hypothetical protein
MPNYNTRLIKARDSYRIKDVVALFDISRKTCGRWIKDEGLKTIEGNINCPLVMGVDLIDFLKRKQASRKIKLKDNEFYCLKCKVATTAREDSENVINTGKTIGKANKKLLLKTGICEKCGTTLKRYASDIK